MSALLDKIVAAAEGNAPAVVHVPEWGVDLHFPSLTPSMRARIRKGIKPAAVEELYVSTLVHLARDDAGRAVFDTDPKTRAKLMSAIDMKVLMRVLWQAGVEEDPRTALIEGLSSDDVLQLLTQVGGADLGDLADLPEAVIDAVKAVAVAAAPQIEAALGREPEPEENRVKAAKNV